MIPASSAYPSNYSACRGRTHTAPSEKSEIARAALRSLAQPSPSSGSSSRFNSSRPPSLFSDHLTHIHSLKPQSIHSSFDSEAESRLAPKNLGLQSLPASQPWRSSSSSSTNSDFDHPRNPDRFRSVSNYESTNYFGAHRVTDSPPSSPRLATRNLSPPSQQPPSLSLSASSASVTTHDSLPSPQQHQASFRRVALSLGVSVEDVRHVAHTHMPRSTFKADSIDHAMTTPISPSSASNFSRPSEPLHNLSSDLVRAILDSLRSEQEKISQLQSFREAYLKHDKPRSALDLRPLPSPRHLLADEKSKWQHPRFQDNHPPPTHRDGIESWQHRNRSHESLVKHNAAAQESPHHPPPRASTVSYTDKPLCSSPRSTSPSPFAFDPLRPTPSQTVASTSSHRYDDPYPQDSHSNLDLDHASRRRWISASFSEWNWSPSSNPHADSAIEQRKGRSIDDYLQRSPPSPAYDDPDASSHPVPSHARHGYQPYPPAASRPPPFSQSLTRSPKLLASSIESPKIYSSSLPKRSPTSKPWPPPQWSGPHTSASTHASSPLVGGFDRSAWGSSTETSDLSRPSDFVEHANSSSRSWSEDTAAEAARFHVANLQIDERKRANRLGIQRSATFKDRSSTVKGLELTRGEIMQRLQDKVKNRMAAKERCELVNIDDRTKSTRAKSNHKTGSIRKGQINRPYPKSSTEASSHAESQLLSRQTFTRTSSVLCTDEFENTEMPDAED